MNRRFLHAILGATSLSLLIGCGYPTLTSSSATHSTAYAQANLPNMTLERLEAVLQAEGSNVQGSAGQWQVTIEERTLFVLADTANNRMRIFTPVVSAANLSAEQVQAVLLANFHTALDARYALSDQVLVSAFVHPFGSLEEDYLRSALSQVATLANNFGSSYSSGAIDFGPSRSPDTSSQDQLAI